MAYKRVLTSRRGAATLAKPQRCIATTKHLFAPLMSHHVHICLGSPLSPLGGHRFLLTCVDHLLGRVKPTRYLANEKVTSHLRQSERVVTSKRPKANSTAHRCVTFTHARPHATSRSKLYRSNTYFYPHCLSLACLPFSYWVPKRVTLNTM